MLAGFVESRARRYRLPSRRRDARNFRLRPGIETPGIRGEEVSNEAHVTLSCPWSSRRPCRRRRAGVAVDFHQGGDQVGNTTAVLGDRPERARHATTSSTARRRPMEPPAPSRRSRRIKPVGGGPPRSLTRTSWPHRRGQLGGVVVDHFTTGHPPPPSPAVYGLRLAARWPPPASSAGAVRGLQPDDRVRDAEFAGTLPALTTSLTVSAPPRAVRCSTASSPTTARASCLWRRFHPALQRCTRNIGVRVYNGRRQLAFVVAPVQANCRFSVGAGFRRLHGGVRLRGDR